MSDIKDKLKQLKHERASRSRSQLVRKSWEKLEQEKNLSTKEKLEQLINLTRERNVHKPHVQHFEPEEREPYKFTENLYSLDAKYGKIRISEGLDIPGDILACLSRDPAFEELDLSTALIIDLETTGLSGGSGVVPFNIGLGYYRDDKFYVGQYFLGEMAAEEEMLQDLRRLLKEMDFQSVITYNGKAFDIPLLETRFILYRTPCPLSALPHLDFLFPARSLWQHKHENCRLFTLAHEVVGTGRDEDIPSAEIPWRYFQYLQTGNFELIEPVLYHNAEDILSLLGVIIVGAKIFSEDEDACQADSMDFYGAGKILEKIGDMDRSMDFFQKALDGDLTSEVSVQAKKRLSAHLKKVQDWEKAIPLWQDMVSTDNVSIAQLFAFRELAMHLEHREKKYEEALKISEEGFVMSMNFSSYYEKDFTVRRERLKKKIIKNKEKDSILSSKAKQVSSRAKCKMSSRGPKGRGDP